MSKDDRPLVEALGEFVGRRPFSFHVPGHKNGELSRLPDELRMALAYDVTELTGLDDLHEPEGVIRQAEEKLSRLYGSDKSFFLVNGSTVGNLAMLYAAAGKDDLVLVQRNAHKSVFHALELTGARPVFLSPEWDEESRTAGGVSANAVKEAIEKFPDIRAAFFTYPTYYGLANKELKDIITSCHEQDIPVLVDEAHGAHFPVNDVFPESALALGADAVVQSAHKTLPAMTMASFLHIQSELLDADRLAHYLHMLQSSSPSYLLMASLDDARSYAANYKEADVDAFLTYRMSLKEILQAVEHVEVIDTDDSLKLLIRVEGYTGFALQEALEQQGIYSELADLHQVLWVLPLLKEGEEGVPGELGKRFGRAVEYLLQTACEVPVTLSTPEVPPQIAAFTPKQISRMKKEWLHIEEAMGRAAAKAVIPYPPGVPLVCAGERITNDHVQQLLVLLRAGARFQGAVERDNLMIETVIE